MNQPQSGYQHRLTEKRSLFIPCHEHSQEEESRRLSSMEEQISTYNRSQPARSIIIQSNDRELIGMKTWIDSMNYQSTGYRDEEATGEKRVEVKTSLLIFERGQNHHHIEEIIRRYPTAYVILTGGPTYKTNYRPGVEYVCDVMKKPVRKRQVQAIDGPSSASHMADMTDQDRRAICPIQRVQQRSGRMDERKLKPHIPKKPGDDMSDILIPSCSSDFAVVTVDLTLNWREGRDLRSLRHRQIIFCSAHKAATTKQQPQSSNHKAIQPQQRWNILSRISFEIQMTTSIWATTSLASHWDPLGSRSLDCPHRLRQDSSLDGSDGLNTFKKTLICTREDKNVSPATSNDPLKRQPTTDGRSTASIAFGQKTWSNPFEGLYEEGRRVSDEAVVYGVWPYPAQSRLFCDLGHSLPSAMQSNILSRLNNTQKIFLVCSVLIIAVLFISTRSSTFKPEETKQESAVYENEVDTPFQADKTPEPSKITEDDDTDPEDTPEPSKSPQPEPSQSPEPSQTPKPCPTPTKPYSELYPDVEPGRVVIVQATNNKFASWKPKDFMNVTEESERKKEWATRHNFDYHYEQLEMEKFDYFVRPTVFRKALAKYPKAEWVWWLDIDTIFMEYKVNFTQFLLSQEAFDNGAIEKLTISDILSNNTWKIETLNRYEDTDLLVTKDLNGLNVGSFLLRRGKFADTLLELWESPLLRKITSRDIDEQPALAYLMTDFEFVRKKTSFVVCEKINALAFKYQQNQGHLVYHQAGCMAGTCNQWWNSGQTMKKQNEDAYKAKHNIN
ncbi:alpha-1,2-galactosyltransferase gmh3 [Planoprotostelium fungivorum]|uniref:Alpha-1,2-galactosyltransferase gmh3 n=1 Tax=Planoprotostelium fungivorum TaxID=1890364 RepID=A0A2P6NQR6_9EUKA|nr:alpha-1,2-galactosyltransferase gmh3 [Planoprotostelium fungivorum]